MGFLSDLFKKEKIMDLPLEYSIDLDMEGHQHIKVYSKINGLLKQIINVNKLSSYGFHIKEDGITYRITSKDLQIIHSILSMEPEIRKDEFISDIVPPILKYLRRKDIHESERSKEITISDKPLDFKAVIKREKDGNINVKIGLDDIEKDRLINMNYIKRTKDGDYARFGSTFFPFPKFRSEREQKLIQNGSFSVKVDDIPDFFKKDLVFFKNNFNAVISEEVGRIKIIEKRFVPQVKMKMKERGWLDFDLTYKVDKYSLSPEFVNNEWEEYIRPDNDTWIKRDNKTIYNIEQKLERLGGLEITPTGYRVPISQFGSIEEFIESIGGKKVLEQEYERFLSELTNFRTNENFRLPEKYEIHLNDIHIRLRPYQRAGIQWLKWLYDNNLHGLLADDMGLGKTMQMGLALSVNQENDMKGNSLILCPKSVIHHWERELDRITPSMRMMIKRYHGPDRNMIEFDNFRPPTIFISTYTTISNDIEKVSKYPFHTLVLDEASMIKNQNSKRTQSIKRINAKHRFALSGTPIENRPSELWSIFDFLMRGHLGKYGTFDRLYGKAVEMKDIKKSKALATRIDPFMMRRLKEDVAKDLPEKIEIDEWVSLTEEQKMLYGSILNENKRSIMNLYNDARFSGKTYTNILAILTKLKQLCNHPKLVLPGDKGSIMKRSNKFDLVIEKTNDIIENEDQLVIFSQFLGSLDLLSNAFHGEDISFLRIDGSTGNRQYLIDRFNEGKANVMIASIKATGYGVNLTAANHVIHFDEWWNPATQDQATDRVHRIGQYKNVYVHKILTENTLEEKIEQLLMEKREVSKNVMDHTTSVERGWSKEQLMDILKPID